MCQMCIFSADMIKNVKNVLLLLGVAVSIPASSLWSSAFPLLKGKNTLTPPVRKENYVLVPLFGPDKGDLKRSSSLSQLLLVLLCLSLACHSL